MALYSEGFQALVLATAQETAGRDRSRVDGIGVQYTVRIQPLLALPGSARKDVVGTLSGSFKDLTGVLYPQLRTGAAFALRYTLTGGRGGIMIPKLFFGQFPVTTHPRVNTGRLDESAT